MKDAFEQSVNQRQNRPAELLAKFIDAVMKSGGKGAAGGAAGGVAPGGDMEAQLDAALVMFRFLSGKHLL